MFEVRIVFAGGGMGAITLSLLGVPFKNIYYVGSSAGATLALLSVEKQLREAAHVGVPGGIVAFSPWGLEVALKEDIENWSSYQQYKHQDGMCY